MGRQIVLGPADPPPTVDLGQTRTVGTKAVGNVGALVWVAEQLNLVGLINRACGDYGSKNGPSVGEMVVVCIAPWTPGRDEPDPVSAHSYDETVGSGARSWRCTWT